MFCGRWNTKIDEKWRLSIPKNTGNTVLLLQREDGCIEIHESSACVDLKEEQCPFAFTVKSAPMNGSEKMRITIPQFLRDSTSFFFGKTVTLVGHGDHFEIWPWPDLKAKKRRRL